MQRQPVAIVRRHLLPFVGFKVTFSPTFFWIRKVDILIIVFFPLNSEIQSKTFRPGFFWSV